MAPAKGYMLTKLFAALTPLQELCLVGFSSAGTFIQSSTFSVLGKTANYSENQAAVPTLLMDEMLLREQLKGGYIYLLPADLFHCVAKGQLRTEKCLVIQPRGYESQEGHSTRLKCMPSSSNGRFW